MSAKRDETRSEYRDPLLHDIQHELVKSDLWRLKREQRRHQRLIAGLALVVVYLLGRSR